MIRPLVLALALLAVWQAYVGLGGIDPFLLPAPTDVAQALHRDRALLWRDFTVTAVEVGLGVVLALLFGLACALAIHLSLTDTRTGARTRIAPGAGFRFSESYEGAFSPDGRLVAIPAVSRGQPRVALVDLARRAATLVPGAPLARSYDRLAWSRNGWLFYHSGAGRIAAYRPGLPQARMLGLRVEPFTDMAAAP